MSAREGVGGVDGACAVTIAASTSNDRKAKSNVWCNRINFPLCSQYYVAWMARILRAYALESKSKWAEYQKVRSGFEFVLQQAAIDWRVIRG